MLNVFFYLVDAFDGTSVKLGRSWPGQRWYR